MQQKIFCDGDLVVIGSKYVLLYACPFLCLADVPG